MVGTLRFAHPTELADRMQNDGNSWATVITALRDLLNGRAVGDVAADESALLVAETSLLPLRNFETWERLVRTELWQAEQKPARPSWTFWRRPHRLVAWLNLCSYDGRKREAALRGIAAAAPNAFLMALALRRLNDWVPQVRSAAREALKRIALQSDPQYVADALWCVLAHWSTWGRMEAADREAVMGLISLDAVALALKSKILRARSGPAAHVLSQLARSPRFDPWIGDFAREAAQPSVRARATRWLLDGRATWTVGYHWRWTDLKWCKGRLDTVIEGRALAASAPLLASLEPAVADKSVLVRRVAAEFVIREIGILGDDAPALVRRLSADPSESVAERGRFALQLLEART